MVLLEEVVAMFPREEAGGFPRETSESRPKRERGSDRIVGSQKLDSASLGVTQAKSRKVGMLVGRELEDASQVADPCGDALTDEGKSGPAGEAKDGWEGSGGFGGDAVGDIRGFRRGSRG